MEAAVEISNLPPSATYDELRAVVGARSVVFCLDGPQASLCDACVQVACAGSAMSGPCPPAVVGDSGAACL